MTLDHDRRTLIQSFALAALPALTHSRLLAQEAAYPSRPVKLIVPNAPGSSVDTIGRRLGASLAEAIGQSIFVDNKAGAAGALGVEAGKAAAPDGYTLIVASSSSITVAPLLQKAISYDPLKDFDFVSLLAVLPNVLVCNTALKEGIAVSPTAQARKLFYDTLVFDAPTLRHLALKFGASQLMVGTDYPFNFHDSTPVESIEQAGFDIATAELMLHANAERFLGKSS